jgi:hypothetical protein
MRRISFRLETPAQSPLMALERIASSCDESFNLSEGIVNLWIEGGDTICMHGVFQKSEKRQPTKGSITFCDEN